MPYPPRQSLRKTEAAGKVTLGLHQEELMHQEAAESSEPSRSSLGTLQLPLSQEPGESSKAPARTKALQGHPPPAQQRLSMQPQPPLVPHSGRTTQDTGVQKDINIQKSRRCTSFALFLLPASCPFPKPGGFIEFCGFQDPRSQKKKKQAQVNVRKKKA